MSPGEAIRSSPIQWVALAIATLGTVGGGVGIRAMSESGITNQQADELGKKLESTIEELGLVRKQLSAQANQAEITREMDAVEIRKRVQHIDLLAKSISRINGGSPAYGWPQVNPDNWETTNLTTHRTREVWSE